MRLRGVSADDVSMVSNFTLIGRARDIAAVEAWLTDGSQAVMTLKGPGGAGKTTLARECMRRRGGPFVELEPCRTDDDVLSAIARELETSADSAAVTARLEREQLIVLDNAEHVIDATRRMVLGFPEQCRVLVTSRERLGVSDELVWDLGALSEADARELFIQRATSVSSLFRDHPPSDDEVDQLVARIDRLPLALELAAFRTQMMSTSQINERLEERFDILKNRHETKERHVSMDGCIEWSWELLDDDERMVLKQCAVFRSSFDLSLVEEVVSSTRWPGDVIETLVERSLLKMEPGEKPSFRLYAGVRRFLERREGPDEEAVVRLLDRLATAPHEEDPWNVLHAFDLGIVVAPERAASLIVQAQPMLVGAGFVRQLPELLDRAIDAPIPDPLRARVLVSRASVAETFGEGDTERWLKRAESLAGDDDAGLLVRIHTSLQRAHRADRLGDHARAERHYAAAQRFLDSVAAPSTPVVVQLDTGRGFNALRLGEGARALELFESARATAESADDATLIARCVSWIGRAQLCLGDRSAAVASLRRSRRLFESTDEVVALALAEQTLAFALIDDDPVMAIEMTKCAEASAVAAQWPQLIAALRAFRARVERVEDAVVVIGAQLEKVRRSADHHDYCGSWLGLVVAHVRDGDLATARLELESLIDAVDGRASAVERTWLDRYATALDVLQGHAPDGDDDFTRAANAVASGSDVEESPFDDPIARLVFDYCPTPLSLVAERVSTREGRRTLRVLDGGKRLVLPSGDEVDLSTRHLLRRLFLRICDAAEASTSVTSNDLIEAGWPDERMTFDSAQSRLYSAIRNLRKLGLEGEIVTKESGYAISADIDIIRE